MSAHEYRQGNAVQRKKHQIPRRRRCKVFHLAPFVHDLLLEMRIDSTNRQQDPQNNPPGRPVRSTRGFGGQRAQLEKTANIVGAQLLNKVTGNKRVRNPAEDMPEGVADNTMAPPPVAKRRVCLLFEHEPS